MRLKVPISGTPEISGAPRNDDEEKISGFGGGPRQGGSDNIRVLGGVDQPSAIAFAADEEENPFARLPDAAVGFDLADHFPQDVNRREVRPQEFQPGDIATEPAVLEKGRVAVGVGF